MMTATFLLKRAAQTSFSFAYRTNTVKKRNFMRCAAAVGATMILLLLLVLPVCAFERSAAEYIPDEVGRYLDKIAGMDAESGETPDIGDLVEFIGTSISSALGGTLSTFLKLMGTAAVLAVLNTVSRDISSIQKLTGYVGCAVCALACADIAIPAFKTLTETVNELGVLCRSMALSIGTLSAAGGNVASAAVQNVGFAAGLSFLQWMSGELITPILALSLGLALAAALSDNAGLRSVSAYIRTLTGIIVSLAMTLLSSLLAYQNLLAQSADSVAARTVKFAAGTLIPVVGGTVGEAVRLIGGSIQYLRTTVGWFFIIAVILLVVPPFIYMLLQKICLDLCAIAARILGCEREGGIFADVASLVGFGAGILSAASLFFIIVLTLFIRTAAAC